MQDADRFADALAAALKDAEAYALKGGFSNEDDYRRKIAAHLISFGGVMSVEQHDTVVRAFRAGEEEIRKQHAADLRKVRANEVPNTQRLGFLVAGLRQLVPANSKRKTVYAADVRKIMEDVSC